MERDKFFIGVNALIIRDNKLLIGKRKNSFGAGEYGLPGGHFEDNERLDESLYRELLEETGLVCKNLTFSNIVNCPGTHGHYIMIGFVVSDFEGEPKLMEPEKCEGWEWIPLDSLPENIFRTHKAQIETYIKNLNYSENKNN